MEILTDITMTEVGYITPQGEVYGFETYTRGCNIHKSLAETLLPDMQEDRLVAINKCGWIKYSPLYFIKCLPSAKPLTQLQKERMIQYLEAKGVGSIALGTANSEHATVEDIKSMTIEELDSRVGLILV